jgi:hypothetical protein
MLHRIAQRYLRGARFSIVTMPALPTRDGGWTPQERVAVLTWAARVTRANGRTPSDRLR